MKQTCSAPKRGHHSDVEAAKCPVHGYLARTRLGRTGLTSPVSALSGIGNISGGDITIEYGSRPMMDMTVDGRLSIAYDSQAENCTVARSISVKNNSTAVNCHSILLHAGGESAERERLVTTRWIDIDGAGNYLDNCSGAIMRIDSQNSSILNSHADMDIMVKGEHNEFKGCTAGRAWFLGYSDTNLVVVDRPGQVLVHAHGEEDWLSGVSFDPETTFVAERGHRWNWPLRATAHDAPGSRDPGDDERAVEVSAEIAALRPLVLRPKDDSEGLWVDARNVGAHKYILERMDVMAWEPPEEIYVQTALALNPNP